MTSSRRENTGSDVGERLPDAKNVGRVVATADLESLYALIKGTPYANWLIDAADALNRQDLQKAVELVTETRKRYEKGRARILRGRSESQAAVPDAREERKREKYHKILAKFDEILGTLRRMVKWQDSRTDAQVEAELRVPQALQVEFESAVNWNEQLNRVREHYDVGKVLTDHDVQPNRLYLIRLKQRAYLVRTLNFDPDQQSISVRSACSPQRFKPLTRAKFKELGAKGSVLSLKPKKDAVQQIRQLGRKKAVPDQPQESRAAGRQDAREILNMGEFSQLMDAAKRSGLVPNADLIAHVRDREFRLEKYQRASQTIEDLFGKFMAAASQRAQRLRREELDIASGKIKMSPKELMAKRARDTAETLLVDRARNRFQRVMEGLRILMNPSTS